MPSIFTPEDAFLSHRNNILQKKRIAPTAELQIICTEIDRRYNLYLTSIRDGEVLAGNLAPSVEAVGTYLDFAKAVEKEYPFFNWRSDYASSILPEYLYRILGISLKGVGITPLFSTRDSIVEVSLSGGAGGGWDVRRKNQDLCIGLRRERIARDEDDEVFVVPLIAIEVKTNIDINKLNGLDFSAERMKRTFPAARYFLVTETIDFSLSANYSSGSIDEIYALRKQMRSQARRVKKPLEYDVFEQLRADILIMMKKASESVGHVYERLEHGRLINVG